jgi:hypothetical protein
MPSSPVRNKGLNDFKRSNISDASRTVQDGDECQYPVENLLRSDKFFKTNHELGCTVQGFVGAFNYQM